MEALEAHCKIRQNNLLWLDVLTSVNAPVCPINEFHESFMNGFEVISFFLHYFCILSKQGNVGLTIFIGNCLEDPRI